MILRFFSARVVKLKGGRTIEFPFASIELQRITGFSVGCKKLLGCLARADELPGLADDHRPAENRDHYQSANGQFSFSRGLFEGELEGTGKDWRSKIHKIRFT